LFRADQLQALAVTETTVGKDSAYFDMADRYFSKYATGLKSNLDDNFSSYWNSYIERLTKHVGSADNLIQRARRLEESFRKDMVRKGLDILCKHGTREDLQRVRKVLLSGFVEGSEADISFFARWGSWEDIETVASITSSRNKAQSLLAIGLSSELTGVAGRAVYKIGKDRLRELVEMGLSTSLLVQVILEASDVKFRNLSDDQILKLLGSDNDVLRKAVCLKCVRALPKARVIKLLDRYHSNDDRIYYNVTCWLDLGVSIASERAKKAAEKEMVLIKK
jgi:hypothetical protein